MLSDMQNTALKNIVRWWQDIGGGIRDWQYWREMDEHGETAPVHYLGGYAGSGKSTMIPYILEELGLRIDEVAFLAPTGKAARVMSEKLQALGHSTYAKTIHSSIYLPTRQRVEQLSDELDELRNQRSDVAAEIMMEYKSEDPEADGVPDAAIDQSPAIIKIDEKIRVTQRNWDQAVLANEGPKFQLNAASKIRNCKLIVVDEASMVGARLGVDLRFFGVPVLAVGDPFQLPPVKDDVGLTSGTPDSFLTEIHRQAKGDPIIELAHRIRNCEWLDPGTFGERCRVVRRRDDEWTLNPDYDAQVIVGTNQKRWNLTRKIRSMCDHHSTGPCEGEPLIICRNSQAVPDFVNGTFVTCMQDVGDLTDGSASYPIVVEDELGHRREIIAVQSLLEEHYMGKGQFSADKQAVYNARRFNEHLDFGWVITAHKSQGSQWPNVVVHDESSVFGREDKIIPFRWLYTAVTRASEELTVVI